MWKEQIEPCTNQDDEDHLTLFNEKLCEPITVVCIHPCAYTYCNYTITICAFLWMSEPSTDRHVLATELAERQASQVVPSCSSIRKLSHIFVGPRSLSNHSWHILWPMHQRGRDGPWLYGVTCCDSQSDFSPNPRAREMEMDQQSVQGNQKKSNRLLPFVGVQNLKIEFLRWWKVLSKNTIVAS